MRATREDPLVRDARREALLTLLAFIAAITYTVSYCSVYGYDRPAESLSFVLGFPDWVFWGILAPWAVCVVFGFVMAFVVMRDEAFEEPAAPNGKPLSSEPETPHA